MMFRSLSITSAPTASLEKLILVDDLRAHLRVDTSSEDFLLETWLKAAMRHVEGLTGAAFGSTTFLATLDTFPDEATLELPRDPVSSIVSVQYVDNAGATQTMSAADYSLVAPSDPVGGISTLALGYGKSWPAARGHFGDVRVSFVAGYASRAAIPPDVVAAVLLIAADLYENREGQGRGEAYQPNPTVRTLLSAHRRRFIA